MATKLSSKLDKAKKVLALLKYESKVNKAQILGGRGLKPAHRKRKTKDPCEGCYLHRDLCICHLIPRLVLKTKVTLIVHAKELKRTTNTGRLAVKSLVNSEMRIRGATRTPMNLNDLLVPDYENYFFFPSDDAIELTADFVKKAKRPIQLIVPDGNWRQASKVHSRHKELKDIPRVKIGTVNTAVKHLRAESSDIGMATLQAIAIAIGIIEGEAPGLALMNLYRAKLEKTLQGRGLAQALAADV